MMQITNYPNTPHLGRTLLLLRISQAMHEYLNPVLYTR